MIRYPLCEVHESVMGQPRITHGPLSRTAAQKLFRRLLREYDDRRPRVQYRISWQTITPAPGAGGHDG